MVQTSSLLSPSSLPLPFFLSPSLTLSLTSRKNSPITSTSIPKLNMTSLRLNSDAVVVNRIGKEASQVRVQYLGATKSNKLPQPSLLQQLKSSEIRIEKMTDMQEKDLTMSGIGDTFRQIISHMKVGGSAEYLCTFATAASCLASETATAARCCYKCST